MVSSGMRYVRGAVVSGALVAVAALTVTTGAAGGTAGASPGAGPGAESGAPVTRTTLVLDKNPADPSRSTLTVYWKGRPQARYRAGSGDGTRDDCVMDKGWIPDGNWRITLKDRRFKGSKIRGYGVALENMRCGRGTVTRTEMSIHSEMERNGTQGTTEPRRWTDSGPNDYLSDGCVKLRPADIKDLFDRVRPLGWPTHLKVVS